MTELRLFNIGPLFFGEKYLNSVQVYFCFVFFSLWIEKALIVGGHDYHCKSCFRLHKKSIFKRRWSKVFMVEYCGKVQIWKYIVFQNFKYSFQGEWKILNFEFSMLGKDGTVSFQSNANFTWNGRTFYIIFTD